MLRTLFVVFPGLLAMVAVLHLSIYCSPMSHVCFVLQPTRSSKRSRLSCEDEERPLASRSPRRSQRVTAVPQVRDVQDVFLVRRIDGSFDMKFGEIAFSFWMFAFAETYKCHNTRQKGFTENWSETKKLAQTAQSAQMVHLWMVLFKYWQVCFADFIFPVTVCGSCSVKG